MLELIHSSERTWVASVVRCARMSAEDQPFSELQLGVRELFRIVVPGAYAVVLFTVLPDAELPESVTSSTVRFGRSGILLRACRVRTPAARMLVALLWDLPEAC